MAWCLMTTRHSMSQCWPIAIWHHCTIMSWWKVTVMYHSFILFNCYNTWLNYLQSKEIRNIFLVSIQLPWVTPYGIINMANTGSANGLKLNKCSFIVMPLPLGVGGIMFSSCPSIRPSKAWNFLFWHVHGPLVHPTNRDRFRACPSVRPSVRLSVRRGFRKFAGERMEGMTWNFTCWYILTIFRTD